MEGAMDDAAYVGEEQPGDGGPGLRHLGEYEILDEIGQGGSGVVYRARHLRLNRIVALKALRGSILGNRDTFERFRIEANAVARLEHPNIAPLYETGADAGAHFLTLRYFERGSLATVLKTRAFTPKESVRLAITAARAMHYAHQRGVLHRDLKPSNLLIDAEGEPHIADFGLAKLADDETSLTLSSSVLGTPNYMAPEQADGRVKQASASADIYSLGAILFELLTGRPPFTGETALAVLRQVADEEPPRPRALNPKLDRDLEAICLCCLEKRPDRRYASAAALADDLERWLDNKPIAVRPATSLERGLKWVRRRPLVAALAACAVVALLAGLAGTSWQWSIARRTAEAARLDAYLTSMDLVQRIIDKQPERAKSILDRYRPKPGEKDLRGWEWRRFWLLCRDDQPEQKLWLERGIFSLALSQDGSLLAVGERNGGAKILNAATFDLIYAGARDVNTNQAPYAASGNRMGCRVAAIPNRNLFAWSETRGASNCVIQLWDAISRKIVRTFPQPYIVRNLVATPDGKRLVVSYQTPDGRTIVWDLDSEKMLAEIPKGSGYSNFSPGSVLAVSPDGKWMTFDEFPDHIRVVEVETGRDAWRFPLQDQYCLSSEFSPDGKTLAVYGGFEKGTSPQLWDLQTGKSLGGFEPMDGHALRMLFSPDGKLLYASGSDHSIWVWDIAERKLRKKIRTAISGVTDLALSPDGFTLYSASWSKLARWNLKTPKPPRGGARLPIAVSWRFLPNNKVILGVTTNGTVAMFSGAAWERMEELKTGVTNATMVDLLPAQKGYVVGANNGNITLHRWSDHAATKTISRMEGPIIYLRADPKTGNIVSADPRTIKVWDTATGQMLATLPTPAMEWGADFLPGAARWTLLLYTGEATHIDLATGNITREQLPFAEAESFSYAPAGNLAVTSGANAQARLYRASDWKFLRKLAEDARGGFFSCFSPDGRLIVTSHGGSEAVKLWDVATGRRICVLGADLDLARETRFSPDGNIIAQSGSIVRAVCLWWAPTWEEIAQVEASGTY
jgi:WD40 repeat protein/tRNA A-37 threonylcarbamoyl transferase component Bud32